MERIRDIRNEMEHYYSSSSRAATTGVLADSFVVIRDFMRNELKEDPLKELGQRTWQVLTDVHEVHEREKGECASQLEQIDWKSDILESAILNYSCDECGSDLIDITEVVDDKWDSEFRCRACDKRWSLDEMGQDAIRNYYDHENYRAYKDGGDPMNVDCPSCGLETYVVDEESCLLCDFEAEKLCGRCSCEIPLSELSEDGYCASCKHVLAKND